MFPKISVIVPVYNAERTLHKCIDSIINQHCKDWELLLIDDGSTDNSTAICDEYAQQDKRIRVFHKQNGGVSSARNVGLDNVNGEWITFCDSDDFVNENWLDIFTKYTNNVNFDLIVQGFKGLNSLVGKKDCYVQLDFKGAVGDGLELLYKKRMLGFCWNKVFKKELLNKYGLYFNEKMAFMEDEEFVLRYLQYCKQIVCIPDVGYNYYTSTLNKYIWTDNYYTSLSNFRSVKNIYKGILNSVYQDYLQIITNALFDSYSRNILSRKEKKERLKLYCEVVGYDIFKVNELSILTKIAFLLPVKIVDFLFVIKSKL